MKTNMAGYHAARLIVQDPADSYGEVVLSHFEGQIISYHLVECT